MLKLGYKLGHYAGIMLDALNMPLCSKLCRHNVSNPRIWCLRLHGKSNLSWPLTRIPLFLMFSNEIRFSRPFFYSNCYFCVMKGNLRSNLALGVAYSVIQSFPARIFSVPLSRRLMVKI